MSNVENAAEPKTWVPRYPSLVCTECQERSLIRPVLPTPTAPYPTPPGSEEIRYPALPVERSSTPYYPEPTLTGTRGDGKLLPISGQNSTRTFTPHNANAMPPAATREATRTGDERIIVPRDTARSDFEAEARRKYRSRICWLVGAFLVVVTMAILVFYEFYKEYRHVIRMEQEKAIDYPRHNYFD